MHKKLLVSVLLIISLIFSVTFCYAENENMQNAGENAKNALNSTGNAIEDAAKGTGDMMRDGVNAVKDGAQNLGNNIKNGVENTGNAIKDGVEDMNNNMDNNDNNTANGTVQDTDRRNADNTNNNYDATRTQAEEDVMGMTGNTWSWIIIGVAAVAIIALIWYYTTQQTNRNRYNNHDE